MIRCLILAALVAQPVVAHASKSCGSGGNSGGSSGGSSGSSGGGGSDSSSSYDSSSDNSSGGAHSTSTGCIDDTDVVGYRRCTKFGTWATNMRIPRMFLELGTNVRQFKSHVGERTGSVDHGAESFTYRMIMPESHQDTAVASSLRLGFNGRHGLYAGTELELGGIASGRGPEMTSSGTFGTPEVESRRGLMLGALGIAGLRGTTSRGAFSLEAAGGVRSARYRFNSTYHNCVDTVSIVSNQGVVEARARAELWLGPWVTAGATLGTSVLDRNDWLAGVYFGFHSRAFGGGR